MGIRSRFMIIILVLSSLTVLGIGVASYKFSENSALNEARVKGEIIFNYIDAQSSYFRHQRDILLEIVEKDRFYPDLMSGFVVTRETWARFKQSMPGYLFKQATIDPLNKENQADADELGLIAEFAATPDMKRKEGRMTKAGEEYFFIARPIKVDKKGCLDCHGDPSQAPKDQVDIYGTQNGYNWRMNDTVASLVVYIPVAQAIAAAKKGALILVLIGAGTMVLMLVILGFFINRTIVSPIVALSHRTEEISLGKDLDKKVEVTSQDEVGALAQAIERLRISLVKILRKNLGA